MIVYKVVDDKNITLYESETPVINNLGGSEYSTSKARSIIVLNTLMVLILRFILMINY